MPPVAIAGVGCISALGATLEDGMQALYAGRRSPGPPLRFPPQYETPHPVFSVPDRWVDPWPYPPTLPLTGRLALIATRQAVVHAALRDRDLQRHRIGICIGSNVGVLTGYEVVETGHADYLLPQDRFTATNPTHLVAETFDLCGPQQTVANACSAGNDAIGIAADWIAAGICDAVIAGGTDEITPRVYFGFKSLLINSEQACRPFDRDRNGLNLGEGAAAFLLASASFCQSCRIEPKGYILGYGASADAHHFTHPADDGRGLRQAVDQALAHAGLAAERIGFVNAHGTGTAGNDLVESRVIADRFPNTPFLSTKGYTGHTMGAAGPIEAALTLGCLDHGRLPATAGYETPDPAMPAHPISSATPVAAQAALTQTLAFGGSNSVLVIGSKAFAS